MSPRPSLRNLPRRSRVAVASRSSTGSNASSRALSVHDGPPRRNASIRSQGVAARTSNTAGHQHQCHRLSPFNHERAVTLQVLGRTEVIATFQVLVVVPSLSMILLKATKPHPMQVIQTMISARPLHATRHTPQQATSKLMKMRQCALFRHALRLPHRHPDRLRHISRTLGRSGV